MNLNVDFNLKSFFSSVFGKEFWDITFLSIAVSPKKIKHFILIKKIITSREHLFLQQFILY